MLKPHWLSVFTVVAGHAAAGESTRKHFPFLWNHSVAFLFSILAARPFSRVTFVFKYAAFSLRLKSDPEILLAVHPFIQLSVEIMKCIGLALLLVEE